MLRFYLFIYLSLLYSTQRAHLSFSCLKFNFHYILMWSAQQAELLKASFLPQRKAFIVQLIAKANDLYK